MNNPSVCSHSGRNLDIDFRVSGLPHAVVKQAENFRVRELVKKIESHPHREALQADLQQNNVYNPLSDDSKAMIGEMGNVELFELCETIPKVQCSECLLYWNQGIVCCTCGHLLKESEASQDAFSIPHYVIKKVRPRGGRHDKLRHRNSISWPTTRGGDVSKRILLEFTIASNEIQFFVIPNSKLPGPRRSASQWISWHRKNHSYRSSSEEYERYQKNWYISLKKIRQNCTDETPIRLPNSSHDYEPSPPRIWRRAT